MIIPTHVVLVQFPKMSFLVGITIVEAYSPLDSSTKPTFNNFVIHAWTKALSTSLNLCRNPTLAKCGGEAQHLEKLEVWSPPGLPNVQSSTARPKTPRIEVFLVSLERSWNVDIENGLALAIRTSAAQVMGKRRAGS
jgi:hypothetical protein